MAFCPLFGQKLAKYLLFSKSIGIPKLWLTRLRQFVWRYGLVRVELEDLMFSQRKNFGQEEFVQKNGSKKILTKKKILSKMFGINKNCQKICQLNKNVGCKNFGP